MMNNEEIKKIKKLFSEKKEIVIIPHKNPDGDAIGSSTALKYFLEKYDHNISIISPNNFPKFLKWMDYKNEIEVFSENNKCIEKLRFLKASFISEVEPGLSMTVSACMRSMPGSFSFPNFGSLLGCSDSRGLKLIPILGGSPANSIIFKA